MTNTKQDPTMGEYLKALHLEAADEAEGRALLPKQWQTIAASLCWEYDRRNLRERKAATSDTEPPPADPGK